MMTRVRFGIMNFSIEKSDLAKFDVIKISIIKSTLQKVTLSYTMILSRVKCLFELLKMKKSC